MAAKARGKKESFDCLLPTGLLITVEVSLEATFDEVKKELWAKAQRMPLFAVLNEPSHYGLRYVSKHAEVQEVDDDQVVGKTSYYSPVLKVFLRKGSREEQKLNVAIGSLISKHLSDFDNMRDPEVNAYRRDVLAECVKFTEPRRKGDPILRALHRYAPSYDTSPLPADLRRKGNPFHVKVLFSGQGDRVTIIKTTVDSTLKDIIQQAVKKDNPDSFVLRFVGRDDYILGDQKLGNYSLVRRALARGYDKDKKDFSDILVLQLESKASMLDRLGAPDTPIVLPKRPIDEAPRTGAEQLWYSSMANMKFSLKIVDARGVVGNLGRLFGIGVKAAIFLGEEKLCQTERTRYIMPVPNPVWGDSLEFDMDLKNLPQSARLCLLLHGVWANPLKVKSKNKNMRNEFPLAWANVSLFDFRQFLRSGQMQLSMWTSDEPEPSNDVDECFVPMGTTLPNPVRNGATVVTIEFPTFSRDIVFPDSDQIDGSSISTVTHAIAGDVAMQEFKKAELVIRQEPLYRLTKDDRALLRKYKFHFKDRPEALHKCLSSIDWTSMNAAQEVAAMLKNWARPTPEQAMGLLDAPFADKQIRSYAVQLIDTMSDEKLTVYMLQLVQMLKYEPYLNNDLARMLLRRALASHRIGHFFFWYLKSEMHLDDVSTRYGLLLEAFCRASEGQMHELARQNDALQRVERIAEALKDKSIRDKLGHVRENLAPKELGEFQLPLDPSVRVGECECRKVFDSAQKPLWFTFKNTLQDGPDVNVMFKCGDDLRQDMLTLQLIRVMDMLWMEAGLDLQMSIYDCLATGDEVGLLEMVMNSATLWKIQGKVSNVWDDTVIHSWLKAKNPAPDAYQKACDVFLASCAGYSVATFVLGIADRHNDNIMLKETGQLFHIDFGHFLGNWKEKFGVRRERVKFILVPDFVCAMTMGQGQKSPRWKQFKDICKQSYLCVRRNAHLFINLLNMMLPTGIPELRSRDDVLYLRDTLYLGSTEEEAADRFMQEIDVALRDSKTVKVNWAFHGVRH